jgi:hypothetical protein
MTPARVVQGKNISVATATLEITALGKNENLFSFFSSLAIIKSAMGRRQKGPRSKLVLTPGKASFRSLLTSVTSEAP